MKEIHPLAEKALKLLEDLPSEVVSEAIINSIASVTLKPNDYKICENCDYIHNKKRAICMCGHYRFIKGKKEIDALLDEVVTDPPELVDLLHWLREKRDKKS
jgi:hypothetical protein